MIISSAKDRNSRPAMSHRNPNSSGAAVVAADMATANQFRKSATRQFGNVRVLLISTYELGHQPFGLASPEAWLRNAGFNVRSLDLAQVPLDQDATRDARLIAFYLPMHTATRIALRVLEKVRKLNPTAHLCCYGLYAPMNAGLLRSRGISTILGGEFEADLLKL